MTDITVYKIKLQKSADIDNISLDVDEVILELDGSIFTGRIAIGTGNGVGTHVFTSNPSKEHDLLTISTASAQYLSLVGQELTLDTTLLLNPDMSIYATKDNVLELDNTTVYVPTEDYNPVTKKYVEDLIVAIGAGDMAKSIYDTNNNGIVDNSEKVSGFTVGVSVPADAVFTDTTYNVATESINGLLSSSDKSKLNLLNVHPTYLSYLLNTNTSTVIDTINIVNGHIGEITTRVLTPSDIGALPDTYTPPGVYDGWDLYINGLNHGTIGDLEDVNFVQGTGINLSYNLNGIVNDITISHADTSGFSKSNLTSANVISNITIDDYGHIQDWVTRALTASDIQAAAVVHTHTTATESSDGFMSKEDKTTLDSISTNGTQSDWIETNIILPSYIKNKPTDLLVISDIGTSIAAYSHTHTLSQITNSGSIASKDFWSGTQSQYDAIGSYDNNTLYFITE